MSLAQKLILYALFVALVPLSAIGFSLVRVGEGALRQRIVEHQQTAASAVAAKLSQSVQELAAHLAALAERFDVSELSPAERQGLLTLLYRQSRDIAAVALVDFDGALMAPPVYLQQGSSVLEGHIGSTEKDVATFVASLPAADRRAGPGTVLMSPVYYPGAGAARVSAAVPCCGGGGAPAAVAAIELALRQDVLRIEGIDTGPESVIYVVDRRGRSISHPEHPPGTDLTGRGAVARLIKEGGRGAVRYRFEGQMRAAAYASVGALGWTVVVEQPEAVAFAAANAMRRQVLGWIFGTTLLVLITSLLFAARLRRLLQRMVSGARDFGEGRLGRRIDVQSSDEIGELASTMNAMAAQLERSLRELEEWSRTLEVKVEQRTEELKQAQAQLLTQSKLAAIGQLGAGVAHEVNNPLAGILGYTQLLMRKHAEGDPELETLKKIEAAAKRCKAITVNLLRFSERGLAGHVSTSLNDVVKEVLDAFRIPMEEAQIEIVEELAPDLPTIVANSGQLALVLINLLSNAKNAMPDGGRLTLATAARPDGVSLAVCDTGTGIDAEHIGRVFEPFFTTKTVWTGVGLGLSVAYRIVDDHGGHLEVESKLGEGATFTMSLPFEPPEPVAEAAPGPRAVLLE